MTTKLDIELHYRVEHPYDGELVPRDKAAAAAMEISKAAQEIIEKHGLTYLGGSTILASV